MATEKLSRPSKNYPTIPYTETLMVVAGVVVLIAWAFLLSTGSNQFSFIAGKSGAALSSLDPVSSALGFMLLGLGFVELGVVVWTVQLAWILPNDHDESGVSPFLCGYCLLGQFLLMFPPLIMLAVVVVPIGLFTLACIGWYFQKFTGLKLSLRGDDQYQNPITMWDLLMMPIYLICFAAIPLGALTFFSYEVRGMFVITVTIGMLLAALVPVLLCYSFLYLYRLKNSIRRMIGVAVVVVICLIVWLEGMLTQGASGVTLAIAFGLAMITAGMRLGFHPWMNEGIQVVIARPYFATKTQASIGFDEVL